MPYKDVYGWKTYKKDIDLGYDRIPTIRPQFVFFEFTGLRPNTPHWIFFDNEDVTEWCNTTYNADDFGSFARNSDVRVPGDKFSNATSFPNSLGGSSATSGYLTTDTSGTLSGAFFIQGNASKSYATGVRLMTAIDISVLNPEDSLSTASTTFKSVGQYQLYYTDVTKKYEVVGQEWYEDPPPQSSGNDDDYGPTPIYSYSVGGTYYNAYTAEDAVMAYYDDNAQKGGPTGGYN